jgi:hypothetical protein
MKTYEELNLKVSTMLEDLAKIIAAEYIFTKSTMATSGMSQKAVKDILLADLTTGGRLFGQLKNKARRISLNTIEEAGNLAALKVFSQNDLKQYKWITVGKNICPDCKERHGDTGDISYFSTIGLPKSGFSVCGHNCNCQLVPIEYDGENLDKPIRFKQHSSLQKFLTESKK